MAAPETTPNFPTASELAGELPQIEVFERIGEGRESAIYHGRQTILDREVMVRLLIEPDPATAAKFMQRLQTRAKLSNPRIVAIYDFGRSRSGHLYLTSEHVNGRVLREMIVAREVPPKLAFSLAMQCCDLLEELHQEGQLHGALDARCVLVQPDGHVKWTGVGMGLTDEGEASWLHGKEASKRGDLMALGSVLHELFAREPLDHERKISRDIPPAFAAVIRRCTDQDSPRALSSGAEIKQALIAALELQRHKAKGGKPAPADQAKSSQPTPAPATALSKPQDPTPPIPNQPPNIEPYWPEPRPYRGPSLISRINEFLWGLLKFSLHAVIFLITATILTVSYLLKDKIVIREGGPQQPSPAGLASPAPASKPAPQPPAAQPSLPPSSLKPTAPSRDDLLSGLRVRYLNRLKDTTQRALDQVQLDDLPHYRNELDLINSGGEVPELHEANTPAALRELREEYHQQRKRLLQRSSS